MGVRRVLLVIEGTTVALILIVSVVILIRLATGTAPNGNTLDFSVFSVPAGTGTSALFLGVVFGFLSFAGFEAAATLGEEAQEPRRDIPRAILGVAIFGGLYYVFVTAVEVMGFGTDAEGVEDFIASGSLLGDLGSQFVAGWVGELITIGAAISAFGCALACVVGATRLLYALSRDEVGPAPLGTVSPRSGVPARSTATVSIGAYVIIALGWFVFGVAPFDLFVASGTIGTLILLLVYALATIGAAKLLFFSGERQVAAWEVVVPFLALVVIGYTLFRNVYPYPTGGDGTRSSPRYGSSRSSPYVCPLRRDAAGRREADGRGGPRREDRLPDGGRQVRVSTLRLRLRLSASQHAPADASACQHFSLLAHCCRCSRTCGSGMRY